MHINKTIDLIDRLDGAQENLEDMADSLHVLWVQVQFLQTRDASLKGEGLLEVSNSTFKSVEKGLQQVEESITNEIQQLENLCGAICQDFYLSGRTVANITDSIMFNKTIERGKTWMTL